MFPITLDSGITFSTLFNEFTSVVTSVWSFFSTNTVFLVLIALPVGALAVCTVVRLFR